MRTFADHDLTAAEHDAWLAGYGHGFADGIDRGRVLAEEAMAERWATVAAAVRRAADVPSFAEIQRRRGVAV